MTNSSDPKLRVLFIDDDPDNGMTLGMCHRNWEVTTLDHPAPSAPASHV